MYHRRYWLYELIVKDMCQLTIDELSQCNCFWIHVIIQKSLWKKVIQPLLPNLYIRTIRNSQCLLIEVVLVNKRKTVFFTICKKMAHVHWIHRGNISKTSRSPFVKRIKRTPVAEILLTEKLFKVIDWIDNTKYWWH